jgi:hypothetical protein
MEHPSFNQGERPLFTLKRVYVEQNEKGILLGEFKFKAPFSLQF